jgi:hypothetical protein
MADKIKVIQRDVVPVSIPNWPELYQSQFVLEFDLDKFYKDYRKATWGLPADAKIPTPTEYFWDWVRDNGTN